ncbi:hypothetical protein J0K78_16990 [Halobacillus sp. GSS1]|uniref:hypothetical protein n=1 Tax=Halobacillus sp. GSS1 TaxID=2815919 RepID=UPI001A907996|nr:hypothetical protein [Halobacillus sp. GSS1]MBN9655974.1 hypothetical protein [Halobacillus sp. GSS1]
MKYRDSTVYGEISSYTRFVPYSKDYDLESFECGIDDYNNFLIHDAEYYIENGISSMHLLIDKRNNNVIGYLAVLADAFLLHKQEKKDLELDVPFSSVPAMKIGKLAVSKEYKDYPYGSFLLEISLGIAQQMKENGIGCRFLTVDADIEHDSDTPVFYEKNGFIVNEHKMQKQGKGSVSMRYDLHDF